MVRNGKQEQKPEEKVERLRGWEKELLCCICVVMMNMRMRMKMKTSSE